MGDPGHIFPRPGQDVVLADSVHVSCWIMMFTAELQLHIFPFQLLCLEYSPKTTLD